MAYDRAAASAVLVAALAVPLAGLSAQDTTRAPADSTRAASDTSRSSGDTTRRIPPKVPGSLPSCDGKVISAIDVRPQPPYHGSVPSGLAGVARLATHLHAVTRPRVVRTFLALHEGEVCTELRRAESERILRAQPFISQARVMAFDDGNGGVRLDVFTVDEISAIGGINLRGQSPFVTFLRAGEGNLAGQGIRAYGEWQDGFFYRDHWAADVRDYGVFNRPYIFNLFGARDQLGGGWTATMIHPFFSDLQRVAWIATGGELRTFVRFLRPDSVRALALDFSRHYSELGGIVRVGPFRQDVLIGATVSQEREEAGDLPVVVTDSGVRVDSAGVLIDRYLPHHTARVNAILGVRDLRFLRVRGFDALTGEQDLPIGIQAGTLVGHSVSFLSSTDNDLFLSGGAYGGWGTVRTFVGMFVSTEAREDVGSSKWDGILSSGRLAWYWKPADPHTVIVSTEFGLGLRQRLPFQLALGDVDGGVRGYRDSHAAGGERIVTRVEERWALGQFRGLTDFGVAGFVDVGRVWAQGAPFGVNSPTAVGVGLGILAAVPPRSKRLLRVDLGIPVTHDRFAKFEIRIRTSDNTGVFYIEPRDLTRGRERTVPTSIFTYPAI